MSQVHQCLPGSTTGSEDDNVEMDLHAALVDMYIHKLRDRERRKKMARDHGLVGNASFHFQN